MLVLLLTLAGQYLKGDLNLSFLFSGQNLKMPFMSYFFFSNGHGLDQCFSENSGCHWRFELKFRGKKKWNLYLALGKVWYRVQARIQEQLCMPSWVFKEEICPQKMLKRCVYLEWPLLLATSEFTVWRAYQVVGGILALQLCKNSVMRMWNTKTYSESLAFNSSSNKIVGSLPLSSPFKPISHDGERNEAAWFILLGSIGAVDEEVEALLLR